MAYPNLLYKGQYTLKRVLTMPADVAIVAADIAKLVTIDATGNVILATADAPFFGVLRTINVNDNICTVDFSGVHEFAASGTITAGQTVIPAGATSVKADAAGASAVAQSKAVALVGVADTEAVQVFFLN